MKNWTVLFGRRLDVDDRLSFFLLVGWHALPTPEGEHRRYRWGYSVYYRLLPLVWRQKWVNVLGRWWAVPLSYRWPFHVIDLSWPKVISYPVPDTDSRNWTGLA